VKPVIRFVKLHQVFRENLMQSRLPIHVRPEFILSIRPEENKGGGAHLILRGGADILVSENEQQVLDLVNEVVNQ
jgi:ribose 5-phosphate isomerase